MTTKIVGEDTAHLISGSGICQLAILDRNIRDRNDQ